LRLRYSEQCMARAKSPKKRQAILDAAVQEIAESGLGASTAKIAARAGIAAGSLFTYFPNKETLLNELYLQLKSEVYDKVNVEFPQKASLRQRVWHVWVNYLDWAIDSPERRKVSVQLHVSDVLTRETRARSIAERRAITTSLSELDERAVALGLPAGFASATMSSMQEVTREFIVKQPRNRKALIEQAFEVYWRAFR
jgi:AcrR family transcriptional regulator